MNYLKYLVEQIHTTVVATIDTNGRPLTAAIDMMDWDSSGVYFLTAKGKGFYDRLKQQQYLALTGIKGADTLHCVSISLSGKAAEMGPEYLPRLLEKNPYMEKIYPTELSRKALTVFKVYEGKGEWFDLSKRPIERASFTFGGEKKQQEGFFITESCIGCESCKEVCPQACIDFSQTPASIMQGHCLRCGNCLQICPVSAVIKIQGE